MDGFALSCRGLAVFGFDVDRLPDFPVEASRLQGATIARNVRNDLQFLPVRQKLGYWCSDEAISRFLPESEKAFLREQWRPEPATRPDPNAAPKNRRCGMPRRTLLPRLPAAGWDATGRLRQ